MIVYHGSNLEIDKIDLKKFRRFKDFGQGFYVTSLEEKAQRMAKRTVQRLGRVPTVTSFEFDMSLLNTLSILEFKSVSDDWAVFIVNNRDRQFSKLNEPLSNHDNKYDIVYGAVANDDIATTFALFRDGIIDAGTLTKRLQYKKLSNQYSFHTAEALRLLKKTGAKTYD
jgi:hypothetical protein